jgi:hypothetical protein
MKQGIMGNHLTREQIAALLDEPGSVAGGLAHLDGCEECAREFEGMSRMRMALSGLPELSPPAGEWAAIRARLPKQGSGAWFGSFWTTPMAAAAIVLLFLGGLGIGRMIAPTGPNGSDASTNLASAAIDPGASAAAGSDTSEFGDYLQQVGRLRELRDEGPVGPAVADDPVLAAERLTRLDALIDATRETLRMAPADPALNDFLFDVVDERATLAGQFDQTLRQASMEY